MGDERRCAQVSQSIPNKESETREREGQRGKERKGGTEGERKVGGRYSKREREREGGE